MIIKTFYFDLDKVCIGSFGTEATRDGGVSKSAQKRDGKSWPLCAGLFDAWNAHGAQDQDDQQQSKSSLQWWV